MTLTSPPVAVAPFESGRLAAGISATDTTITVSPIYKTVNGVRTKQGFNSTSGIAIISQGDFTERISFEGASVDATTKVSSLTTCVRGLSATSTTASFAGGTGRIWPKGAKITLVSDVSYFQSGVFTNVANSFSAKQTFAAGADFTSVTRPPKLPELTQAQENALTPEEGMMWKNTDTGTLRQYSGGAISSVGTDTTANGSTTVAGKYEEATVAEQGTASATGSTGARLIPAVANIVKTSSGAGDENKLAILNASGQFADGYLGSGSASASNCLLGNRTWGTLTAIGDKFFGTGSDGAPTWTSGASLDPATEKQYTTATIPVSQTVTVSTVNVPLIIHNTGDVTINGTFDLNSKGGEAGNGGNAGSNNGFDGTAGNSIISGYTNGAGVKGLNSSNGGGGGGGSSFSTDGGTGTNGSGGGAGGAGGTSILTKLYTLLANLNRAVVCGGGGAGGAGATAGGGGGAGGAGGGACLWIIGGNLTLGASSVLRANGGNGTNGGTGAGGGGAGAGGTIVILVAGTIMNSGVTATASAGSIGTGGGGGGTGGNGGAGGAGKVIIYSLSTGTLITA